MFMHSADARLSADPLEEDEILTTREAAELLKVNPVVLARWANEGRIPAARLGNRRWRFRRQELIEWLFDRGAGRQKQARASD